MVLGLATSLVCLVPCSALADAPDGRQAVFVVPTEGRCPAWDAVTHELQRLQPTLHQHVVLDHPAEDAIALLVVDLTERYQVSIEGVRATTKSIGDPDRRCDKRAIIAAQTLLLALEPPPLPAAPAPLAQPVAQVVPPPARRTAPEVHVDLEAAGVLEGAPNDQGSVSGGASLRLLVGSRHVAGSLGLKLVSPTPLNLKSETTSKEVSLLRVPIDLSLRGRLRWGKLEGQGEIGVLFFTGVPLEGAPGFTAGLRAALMLHVWIRRRIAPFVGVQTDVTPAPMRIEQRAAQDPGQDRTGSAPLAWIGVTVGLAVRLK